MFRLGSLAFSIALASFAIQAANAQKGTFNLFGYGPGIGGLSIMEIDGLAYLGDPNKPNTTVNVPTFTLSSSTLLASPSLTNTTPDNTSSNAAFYVPTTPNSATNTNSNRQAGFLLANETASSDLTVSGWRFYGQVLLLVGSDGAWNSLFYAEATGEDGLWALTWNSTSKDAGGAVPLAIRSTPPAVPDDENAA